MACAMEQIRTAMNAKHSACCFLDEKKAFDTLDHGILLDNQEVLGFKGPVLDLFTSYLSKRSEYMSVKAVNLHLGNEMWRTRRLFWDRYFFCYPLMIKMIV